MISHLITGSGILTHKISSTYLKQHERVSKMLMQKKPYIGIHSIKFHVSGILGQAKLIYSDRKHSSCQAWAETDCYRAQGNLLR